MVDARARGWGREKLFLVDYAIPNEDVITGQKAVHVPQDVCDIGRRFLLFEQIRQHRSGFLWPVGFTEFGQPSEGCPLRGVLFDPCHRSVPTACGAQGSGVSAINVDFKAHEG